jgi:hypothetical protein
VTRINYTDRKYTVNTRKTKNINALSHSHIFLKGNKIRIVVTNLDTAPDDVNFLGTNPQVLPVLKSGSHKIYLSSNCYFNMPVQSAPVMVSEGYDESKTEYKDNNKIAYNFSLIGNYPNPFNPSTLISYSISKSSFVSIKVYDIMGREIATLINEQKNPGKYSVEFNSARFSLSTGVYFCRLTAENKVDVKRMLLIK